MTPATTPTPPTTADYERAAQEYMARLSPEHFMESTAQATQRKITVESFDLVHEARPDVHCFNELMVQWPRPGHRKAMGQVVPDNMVVVCPEPIRAEGSFATKDQPAGPFLMLEYVSKHNKRKDYEDSFDKYETELKVPYYLLFYPDNQDLTLFRLADGRYAAVPPNAAGRLPVPELELEVALLDGWARFWFRGELLPLPADLLRQLNTERQARRAAEERATDAEQRAAAAEAESARLREELARARGERP